MCAYGRESLRWVQDSSERGIGFGLLREMRWDWDVDDSCVVMESRCVGRVAFLAPLANFADFRDHGIFSFGR